MYYIPAFVENWFRSEEASCSSEMHRYLLVKIMYITQQYRDWQEIRLGVQMSEMKKYVKKHPDRNLSFTVHVGDIQKIAHTNCAESAYVKTATLLREG